VPASRGWYKRRRDNGYWYACRHNPARRQVDRRSLGTGDPEEAELAFHRFVLEHAELKDARADRVTVAAAIERYWVAHRQHVAGADTQRLSLERCVLAFGDLIIAELTPAKQLEFIKQRRAKGEHDGYIKRTLGAARAAVGWLHRQGELSSVPYFILSELKDSRPRERVLELDELQALWRQLGDLPLRRFVAILIGTGARPGAVVNITPYQVDMVRKRIDLQPPGKPATDKRNPILPIVPSLMPWLEPRAPYIVEYRMKKLRAGWRAARISAGLGADVTPYVIRHTVATALDEHDVPEGQIEQWLGHGKESTTRRWYIKRRVYRPTYLAAAAAAVEELLKATMSEAGRVGAPPASNPSNWPCAT
jgi:integrase